GSVSSTFIVGIAPDAPTIGTATRGNASGSVTFTPGSDNGIPITSFTVSCSSTDGDASGSATGSSSPIVVSGLTNGKTYTCTVTAANANGSSFPSGSSNSFVPATVPNAPAVGTATRGNTSVSVAFTPSSDG